MSKVHRVFVSYHHANDQGYKNVFEVKFGKQYGVIVPNSVGMDDIDPNLKEETIRQKIRDEFLRQSSVTVVLLGTQTWQRKHVDWEIAASIRATEKNPRSGLLALMLPSYLKANNNKMDLHTIPPRLADNVDNGYAVVHKWTENPGDLQDLIHQAYLNKGRILPNNSRTMFSRNRAGMRWTS